MEFIVDKKPEKAKIVEVVPGKERSWTFIIVVAVLLVFSSVVLAAASGYLMGFAKGSADSIQACENYVAKTCPFLIENRAIEEVLGWEIPDLSLEELSWN